MTSDNPVLNALAQMEERIIARLDEGFRQLGVGLDERFDALHKRLDHFDLEERVLAIEGCLPRD
jgi:hypothetical protein